MFSKPSDHPQGFLHKVMAEAGQEYNDSSRMSCRRLQLDLVRWTVRLEAIVDAVCCDVQSHSSRYGMVAC